MPLELADLRQEERVAALRRDFARQQQPGQRQRPRGTAMYPAPGSSAGLPAYNVLVEGYSQALDNDVVLSMKQANIPAVSRFVDSGDFDLNFSNFPRPVDPPYTRIT